MIDKLIEFALTQRAVTLMLVVAVVVLGLYSIFTIPTDSFPDVSNVQVQIITEPESMASEEVESLVTIPIEYALNGLPYIQKVRSSSEFGMSVVTAIFDDNCDVYFARTLVQQRLNNLELARDVPRPQLGPLISSFSQVYMYQVSSDKHNLTDLRTIQDWQIAKRLLAVSGVGNVVTYGGWVKQYQIMIDQYKLRAYKIRVQELLDIVANSNVNAGGNFIEVGDEEVIIRGLGRVKKLEDLSNIVLKEQSGTPILLKNVARVEIGPAFRRGSASMNGKGEAIIGIVLSRKGANTKAVVEKIEARLKKIEKDLPEGVRIESFYNQKELVDKTTETVKEILLFSGGLVIVVLSAILMNIPASLIVAVVIPLSLLFSFIMMKFTGLSANLMTLGAVDFGVVVDAGVVMVENIFRKLSMAYERDPSAKRINTLPIIIIAAKEVGRPITFAMMIIVAVYLPLFALEGIEGKMFHPLALTFIYALIGALAVALLIIPALCFWFLRNRLEEKHSPVIKVTEAVYLPLLERLLNKPKPIIVVSIAALLGTSCLIPFLGSEFMPSLDEGSIWLRLRMPPSISHTRTIQHTHAVEKMISKFPEVSVVATRIGRSGMGSDIEGVDAADIYIGLKPKQEWKDRDKQKLVDHMAAECAQIPGMMYSFSQPIADMIDDLITGIKADVGIKVFGDDLATISSILNQVRSAVRTVKGTGDITREPIIGAPQLKIELNRQEMARHGLQIGEVQNILQTALAGKVVTEVVEGSRRFGVLVRLPKEYRQTENDVRKIVLDAPDGVQLSLDRIARVYTERGALLISREDGMRRGAVMVNIRGRDLGSWVHDAQEVVAKKVPLPPGYSIVWGGQFDNQQRAMARLAVVVPIVLFIIFILLFFTFHSIKNAAIIMLNVPFATIGGIIALYISHQPVSVPAIIGFIALFGVAVQNGVILVSYIQDLEQQGVPSLKAVREGAAVRLRPVIMTALVAMMGLLPKLFSDGTGAEIQRPLATVVFGGLLTATSMTLLVLPCIYLLVNKSNGTNGFHKNNEE